MIATTTTTITIQNHWNNRRQSRTIHNVSIVKLLLRNTWIMKSFDSHSLPEQKIALNWCCKLLLKQLLQGLLNKLFSVRIKYINFSHLFIIIIIIIIIIKNHLHNMVPCPRQGYQRKSCDHWFLLDRQRYM